MSEGAHDTEVETTSAFKNGAARRDSTAKATTTHGGGASKESLAADVSPRLAGRGDQSNEAMSDNAEHNPTSDAAHEQEELGGFNTAGSRFEAGDFASDRVFGGRLGLGKNLARTSIARAAGGRGRPEVSEAAAAAVAAMLAQMSAGGEESEDEQSTKKKPKEKKAKDKKKLKDRHRDEVSDDSATDGARRRVKKQKEKRAKMDSG